MDTKPRTIRRLVSLLGLVAFAAACGDSTGVGDPQSVMLSFQIGGAQPALSAGPSHVAGSGTTGGPAHSEHPTLMIEGTNGTLVIDEIRLIVAEVELDGEDDACDDDSPATDDCADFEAPPRFLNLPLDGMPVDAFVGVIPPGVYEELEFEIEDLEDDEDDTEFAAEIAALRDEILAEFPDWPDEATGLVVGSFQPTGGDPISFRVYLEAEIEVERDLVPPLVIGEGDAPDLTVDIRPDIWFGRSDGSVMDLSMYDFDTTGEVLEFELEMEDGFTEIEFDS